MVVVAVVVVDDGESVVVVVVVVVHTRYRAAGAETGGGIMIMYKYGLGAESQPEVPARVTRTFGRWKKKKAKKQSERPRGRKHPAAGAQRTLRRRIYI